MSDAQLFGEVKLCPRLEPEARGVALLTEAQRRLRGRVVEKTELIERMGHPSGGDNAGDILTWTKGQFTGVTADSVLVYVTYERPMLWQFWFAAKNGRIVGSGVWQAPQE
jgi:hypothetical protein